MQPNKPFHSNTEGLRLLKALGPSGPERPCDPSLNPFPHAAMPLPSSEFRRFRLPAGLSVVPPKFLPPRLSSRAGKAVRGFFRRPTGARRGCSRFDDSLIRADPSVSSRRIPLPIMTTCVKISSKPSFSRVRLVRCRVWLGLKVFLPCCLIVKVTLQYKTSFYSIFICNVE
jgi:hypothetical protein